MHYRLKNIVRDKRSFYCLVAFLLVSLAISCGIVSRHSYHDKVYRSFWGLIYLAEEVRNFSLHGISVKGLSASELQFRDIASYLKDINWDCGPVKSAASAADFFEVICNQQISRITECLRDQDKYSSLFVDKLQDEARVDKETSTLLSLSREFFETYKSVLTEKERATVSVYLVQKFSIEINKYLSSYLQYKDQPLNVCLCLFEWIPVTMYLSINNILRVS